MYNTAMKIVHYTDVPAENPGGETRGVTIRWVISEEDGAPNYYMRVFDIAPGGYSPLHRHPWEHEVYILSGEGEIVQEDGSTSVSPGTAVFIPGDELHQIRNPGEEILRFICTIPSSGS
jgi:quercetin dioxygenase-like cupin family protein